MIDICNSLVLNVLTLLYRNCAWLRWCTRVATSPLWEWPRTTRWLKRGGPIAFQPIDRAASVLGGSLPETGMPSDHRLSQGRHLSQPRGRPLSNRTNDASLPPGARGVRLGEGPAVSVVVASLRTPAQLRACLESLIPPCRARQIEVVLVRANGEADFADLARTYPDLHLVDLAAGSSAAELRSAGMAAAGGDIVAIMEDDGPVDPSRIAALRRTSTAPRHRSV